MGAGILPVCIYKSQLLFLFGKEQYHNLWSDFGGSSEPYEKNKVIITAIREGAEETNGFFGMGEDLTNRVEKSLVRAIYYDSYTTFLFKIPYDKHLPLYYNNNNRFVEKYLPRQVKNRSNGLFEKNEIQWYSYADLTKYRNNFRPFYRPIIDTLIKDYSDLVSITKEIKI